MTWADKRETRLANTSSKNKRGTACCRIYTRASNFLIAFPSDIFMVDYSSRGYSHRASGHDQSLPHPPQKPFHAAHPTVYVYPGCVYTRMRARFNRNPAKLNESGLLHERAKTRDKHNCRAESLLALKCSSAHVSRPEYDDLRW